MLRHKTFATAAASVFERPPAAYNIFDRNAKRLQKDRAALRNGGERSRTVDYVRDAVADNLLERIMVHMPLA